MNLKLRFLSVFLYIFLSFSLSFSYEDKFEKRINLWPFIVYIHNKKINSTRVEIIGPLIYKYSFHKEKGFSLRPLISVVKKPEEKKVFFLSPLGFYRSNPEEATFKLTPIIKKTWAKNNIEGENRSFELFPFFWGKASDKGYGGIFPIFGILRNKFGKQKITFLFWPLYSEIESKKYTAKNYLWPFIRIVKPLHKSSNYGGYKFWPFYGHFVLGNIEKKFIFWPFYIKTVYKADTGIFSKKIVSFPFYIKEDTETYHKKIYLWPFFQKIEAKKSYYKQIDAPWPFYRKIEGEDIKGFRLWPFYGYVKKKDSYKNFLLWPFYLHKEVHIHKNEWSFDEAKHRFLIFSKYSFQYSNEKPLMREVRIWPFVYSYTTYRFNKTISTFPSILPIYDEGLERNYGPLLNLVEYYTSQDYKFLKILWGLYRFEKYRSRSVQEFAFLVRKIKDESIDTNYIEFLEGLLGLGKIEGKPVVKLFFINFISSQ